MGGAVGRAIQHEYVPTSRWTGSPRFPRWAVCKGCGWEGPVRRTWAEIEADYAVHPRTQPDPTPTPDARGGAL